jgi:hypothetical protein
MEQLHRLQSDNAERIANFACLYHFEGFCQGEASDH